MATVAGGSRLVVAQRNLRGFRGLTLDGFGALLQAGPNDLPQVLRRPIANRGRAALRSAEDAWRRTLRSLYEADPFIAFREVHQQAFQKLFKEFGISADVDRSIDETFDEYRGVKAYPEVPSVLRQLEGEVAMAVVSNMDTKLLLEALQNNGLAFTFVITSEEEQRYKPSASIFRRAIRYLGLPASNILHAGDSYGEDVAGAAAVGMGSILIQRSDRPDEPRSKATAVVRDLGEVREFVLRSWG
ncbi:MAG: HAD family hydrolase [Thermoplasmata archaeon]